MFLTVNQNLENGEKIEKEKIRFFFSCSPFLKAIQCIDWLAKFESFLTKLLHFPWNVFTVVNENELILV